MLIPTGLLRQNIFCAEFWSLHLLAVDTNVSKTKACKKKDKKKEFAFSL